MTADKPFTPKESSPLELLDSCIASHRAGELEGWELQLVRRRLVECAKSETRPIAEVSIPLTEAINEPCKGCGKRPIDFISGAQGNDPAPGRWGVTGVRWNGCTHPWVGDPKVMPKKWTCYCGTVVYRSREDAVDD
jgi:hypothetical protein